MNRLLLDVDLIERGPERRDLPVAHPSEREIRRARELGVHGPILVRALGRKRPVRYALVSGESAWLAAQAAGIAKVEVFVTEDLSDEERARLAAEDTGIAKRGESPIDQARSLKALCERSRISIAEAARQTGRSRTTASHLLRLLTLSNEVQALIHTGKLSGGHARALVGLSPKRQLALAQRAMWEGASVRALEGWAREARSGAASDKASAAVRAKAVDPDIRRLEDKLSEHVGCAAHLHMAEKGGQGGALELHFDNLEILSGILARLGYREDS